MYPISAAPLGCDGVARVGFVVRRCRQPLRDAMGRPTRRPHRCLIPTAASTISSSCLRAGPWARAARWRSIIEAISGSPNAAAPTAAPNSNARSHHGVRCRAAISSKRSAAACCCSRMASSSTGADHIWVTDGHVGGGKGDDVLEFDRNGKLLRTLGKPGVLPATVPIPFTEPNAVAGGAQRRYLRLGWPRAGQGQCAHRQIRQARQVHQAVGHARQRAGPVRSAAHAGDGLQGPTVRRRSRQQPHSDFRSGRQVAGSLDAVQPTQRHITSTSTTSSTSPIRSRATPTAMGTIPAGNGESASAAPRTAWSRPSSRTPIPIRRHKGTTSGGEGIAVDGHGNIYSAEVGRRLLYERQ